MAVSNEKAQKSVELGQISIDLIGVRQVHDGYGQMPSDDYKIFMIIERDKLEVAKEAINHLIENGMPANEKGERQFVMVINNSDQNQPVYMDNAMKNSTIDQFKEVLPILDDAQEQMHDAKLAEINAL